jgi:hypothetical protein
MAMKYIYQHLPLQALPKFTQIGVLGLVIYVPSALHPTLQADAIILVKKKMKKYL